MLSRATVEEVTTNFGTTRIVQRLRTTDWWKGRAFSTTRV